MTAVSTRPGRAAGTRRELPLLIGHQFRSDLRCFRRNTQSVFFTLLMPVLFLVIFASIFRNATVKVPGGSIKESVYYVPGIIAYGVIAAAFSNLAVSVVRNRESGIYKRRRATPLPASAVIAGRAAVAVLTALAMTVVLLVIGWAAYGASIPGRTAPAFVLDIIVGAVVFCCLGFAAGQPDPQRRRGPARHLGHRPAALLHLRRLHPHLRAARLAGRHRLRLPRPSPRRRPAGGLQPAHHRVRAELGLPGHPGRLGRGRTDHRRPPVQLASARRLKVMDRDL